MGSSTGDWCEMAKYGPHTIPGAKFLKKNQTCGDGGGEEKESKFQSVYLVPESPGASETHQIDVAVLKASRKASARSTMHAQV